jgi:hypothetical protein
MTISVLLYEKKAGPTPAVGRHAEVLAERVEVIHVLTKCIELERAGTYDGFGQNFWIDRDPVLVAARKLVVLAEQRVSELRDAASRG